MFKDHFKNGVVCRWSSVDKPQQLQTYDTSYKTKIQENPLKHDFLILSLKNVNAVY